MTKTDSGLHAALLAAKSQFKPIQKDAVNTFLKGSPKYATLDAVLEGVAEALASNHINVVQKPAMLDGKPYLLTTLHHVPSGQEETGTYPLPEGADPQRFGAAITYARRYSLPPMLGVTAEEDTDGESAKPVDRKPAQSPSAPKQERKAPAPKDADPNDPELGKDGYNRLKDRLKAMADELGLEAVLDRFVAECGVEFKAHYSDIDHPCPYVLKSFLMSHGVKFEKDRPWGVHGMLRSKSEQVNALLDSIEAGLSGEGFEGDE